MTDVQIEGRSRDNATLLLAAAEDLDLGPEVVRTTTNGYVVPEEVADKAGLGEDKPKKAPAKKSEPKKTAAKKTAAKKSPAKKAAKKTAPKE